MALSKTNIITEALEIAFMDRQWAYGLCTEIFFIIHCRRNYKASITQCAVE